MTLIPWDVLTSAVEELDRVRVQFKEALSQERASRFYDLLRLKRVIGEEESETVGTVVELTDGYILVCWSHEAGFAIFPSNIAMRRSLHVGREVLLSLVEVVDRQSQDKTRHAGPISPLTNREKHVLVGIGHGLSNSQIAFRLGLAQTTIKKVSTNIYRKLHVEGRIQAALLARDLNLLAETDNPIAT